MLLSFSARSPTPVVLMELGWIPGQARAIEAERASILRQALSVLSPMRSLRNRFIKKEHGLWTQVTTNGIRITRRSGIPSTAGE